MQNEKKSYKFRVAFRRQLFLKEKTLLIDNGRTGYEICFLGPRCGLVEIREALVKAFPSMVQRDQGLFKIRCLDCLGCVPSFVFSPLCLSPNMLCECVRGLYVAHLQLREDYQPPGVCNSSASTTLCDSVRPGPAPLTHSHPIRPVELASGKSPAAVSQGTRCECCRCRQHAEKSQARGHPRREGGCTGQTATFMARTTCVQSTPERRQARRRR